MNRFPLDVRSNLAHLGFMFQPWSLDQEVKNHFGVNPDETLQFIFGKIDGLLTIHDLKVVLIAIRNAQPGNGEFAKCMGLLETVSHDCGYAFCVAAIWNERLLKHLLEKRGYEPLFDDWAVLPVPATA